MKSSHLFLLTSSISSNLSIVQKNISPITNVLHKRLYGHILSSVNVHFGKCFVSNVHVDKF